jgi:predicted ATPase
VAAGTILRGVALATQGQSAEGIAQISQGFATLVAAGAKVYQTYYLALLAEAYGRAGSCEEGLRVLADALAAVDDTEECWWEAELHRLRGELLLRHTRGQSKEAEVCFQEALGVACRQQAKSLELRAAMSLARLWQQQGKRTKAYELLAPVYDWFTEGFDTVDLQEARVLVEALA